VVLRLSAEDAGRVAGRIAAKDRLPNMAEREWRNGAVYVRARAGTCHEGVTLPFHCGRGESGCIYDVIYVYLLQRRIVLVGAARAGRFLRERRTTRQILTADTLSIPNLCTTRSKNIEAATGSALQRLKRTGHRAAHVAEALCRINPAARWNPPASRNAWHAASENAIMRRRGDHTGRAFFPATAGHPSNTW